MGKRIVIALGGNALGNNLPEQIVAVRHTAKAIADSITALIRYRRSPQAAAASAFNSTEYIR